MKKILATLSVLTLATTSATTVISCSSNVNYKQFLQWIDNKETFLLYIGAKDCDFCQKFEANLESNKTFFDNKLEELSGQYNNSVSSIKPDENSFTGYGEELNNNLNLREFVSDEKANNFKEKWSENIINWLIDRMTDIYYKSMLDIGSNETIQKKVAKSKVKEYFDKIKATPMFLIIRNGKIVSWEIGFDQDETGWVENSLDKLIKKFSTSFLNSEIETELVEKINTGSSGESESGGESGSGEGSGSGSGNGESGGESTDKFSTSQYSNINYKFDTIWNKLKNLI
ncbi:hypothetical protein SLITO_v1c02740 [Spiroplasma litorale]|uniref:Lipoprotein n=1 Tax=Spiroplasma litorale TaxID=216942 RepID=A0A0K1W0T1_9MOLU|nr:hypothetical protein [Spiroplasma litorale]AKX33929.1 hypothetical protein SLITO_v1c02740 [Spiroplasma litorale]